jgi:hypothetical protein
MSTPNRDQLAAMSDIELCEGMVYDQSNCYLYRKELKTRWGEERSQAVARRNRPMIPQDDPVWKNVEEARNIHLGAAARQIKDSGWDRSGLDTRTPEDVAGFLSFLVEEDPTEIELKASREGKRLKYWKSVRDFYLGWKRRNAR